MDIYLIHLLYPPYIIEFKCDVAVCAAVCDSSTGSLWQCERQRVAVRAAACSCAPEYASVRGSVL
jgi:hypothetical protein